MSDIAKCLDSLCPSKEYCHRYTSPVGLYQSYGGFSREADEDNCNMFWSNGKCQFCGLENNNHKMSCPTKKIQINL